MTRPNIEAIKALAEKATPGPWYADGWAVWDDESNDWMELHDTDADAQFISHSREDIPALLDYIAELETGNVAMRQEWQETHGELRTLSADLARVTAERDAAVGDLVRRDICDICKWESEDEFYGEHCGKCTRGKCIFEWRGAGV